MPAPSLADLLAGSFLDRAVELLRLSAGEMRRVKPTLARIEREAVARLLRLDLSHTNMTKLESVLIDIKTLVNNGYSAIAAELSDMYANVIQIESGWVAGMMNSRIGVALVQGLSPSSTLKQLATDSLILGAPSRDWWMQQSQRLAFRFAQELRQGLAMGENNGVIIQRVRGLTGLRSAAYRDAEALVRTSVQQAAHAARLETFKSNEDVVKGVQQISTLDSRTSDICIAYDHAAWDLDGNPIMGTPKNLKFNGGPPRHWNCRSVLVPVVKSWKELGSKFDLERFQVSTRASVDGAVATKTTYRDYLATKSEAEQNRILGAGRAQLFRDGKISLSELLDQRGRPLTLEELKKR